MRRTRRDRRGVGVGISLAARDARHTVPAASPSEPGPDLESVEPAILQQGAALAARTQHAPRSIDNAIAPPAAEAEPATPAVAPTPAETVAAASSAPGGSPVRARRRWPRVVIAAGAVVVIAGSLAAVLLHPWRSDPVSPPALLPGTGPVGDSFPHPQERALMAHFPAFVEGCHRYSHHYAKAVAEVECNVTADHPGARSIVFQNFANYQELEEHFHHVLALTIQTEAGKPFSGAYSGPCSHTGSGFFAFSNYPTTGEVQDPVASPTSRGHFFCYLDHAGVPRVAWTNVNWLVVAQAAGDGPGIAAQTGLLDLWEFAGPTGTPAPDPALTKTPAAVVSALYERYLLREPEDGAAVQFWVGRLATVGFAQVSNEFAGGAEAKVRITLPVLKQGLGGH
jgi:hypothetical protein